jgi:hypothetical protein
LGTSDAYLWKRAQTRSVKQVSFHAKKSIKDKMAEGLAHLFNKSYDSVSEKLTSEHLQ